MRHVIYFLQFRKSLLILFVWVGTVLQGYSKVYDGCQVPLSYDLPHLKKNISVCSNDGWSCCSALIRSDILPLKHSELFACLHVQCTRLVLSSSIDVYDPDRRDLSLTCG